MADRPRSRGATRLAWGEVWLQHPLRKAGGELGKLWRLIDFPANATEPYHYYPARLHRVNGDERFDPIFIAKIRTNCIAMLQNLHLERELSLTSPLLYQRGPAEGDTS